MLLLLKVYLRHTERISIILALIFTLTLQHEFNVSIHSVESTFFN
jgi:hypothetical protein